MTALLKYLFVPILLLGLWKGYQSYVEFEEQQTMLSSQLETEKAALEKSQKALGEIKVFQDSLETQRGITQALKTQLEQMQNQLPVEPQGTEVIRELTTISENINMRKRVINPAPEVVNTDFVIEKFNIEGELTYIQLIVFLEQLMKTGRIYDMNEINVSTLAESKNSRYNYLRFNASLQTFRFNGTKSELEPEIKPEVTP